MLLDRDRSPNAADHVDVLIVGAGLSGIGAAHHLQERCPGKSYAILEAREAIGGTWDLFRYPGHPLRLRHAHARLPLPALDRRQVDRRGRRRSSTTSATPPARPASTARSASTTASSAPPGRARRRAGRSRSSAADTGETVTLTCGFLFMNSGYYRYDEGYTPEFPGLERFAGEVVHPQHWPEDLDYAGKRVVVIGSGATAMTLVPAMAEDAAKVTMLQRSPTYVVSMPGEDGLANRLRRHPARPRRLSDRALEERARAGGLLPAQPQAAGADQEAAAPRRDQSAAAGLRRRHPLQAHATTPGTSASAWSPTPTSSGRSATAAPRSSPTGSRPSPRTGSSSSPAAKLEADVVITATGLNLLFLGGMKITIDGVEPDLPRALTYKGMMLSDFPNFAYTLGYTNASWTLKADLTSEYVCRLLNHMDAGGYRDLHAAGQRPLDHRGAAARLQLRLRPALDRPPAQAGLEGAVETAPELPGRPADAAPRPDRRRHDAVLQPGAAGSVRGGDPGPRFVLLIEVEDLHFAWRHPGEHAHRLRDPLDVGDECEPFPGGVVAHPGPEPGLGVLDPGARARAPSKSVSTNSRRSSPDSTPSRSAGSSTSR